MKHEQLRDLSHQLPREQKQEAKRILDTAPWAQILLDELAIHSEWNRQHCERVGSITYAIATAAQLEETQKKKITIAGFVHDVGKICIPHRILDNGNGQLTEEDWDIIRQHPRYSYNIIKLYDEFVAQIALGHHRVQENPYPPIEQWEDANSAMQQLWRYLSIADVTDAYLSPRPNSPLVPSYEQARIRLVNQFGEDPLLGVALGSHKLT